MMLTMALLDLRGYGLADEVLGVLAAEPDGDQHQQDSDGQRRDRVPLMAPGPLDKNQARGGQSQTDQGRAVLPHDGSQGGVGVPHQVADAPDLGAARLGAHLPQRPYERGALEEERYAQNDERQAGRARFTWV